MILFVDVNKGPNESRLQIKQLHYADDGIPFVDDDGQGVRVFVAELTKGRIPHDWGSLPRSASDDNARSPQKRGPATAEQSLEGSADARTTSQK